MTQNETLLGSYAKVPVIGKANEKADDPSKAPVIGAATPVIGSASGKADDPSKVPVIGAANAKADDASAEQFSTSSSSSKWTPGSGGYFKAHRDADEKDYYQKANDAAEETGGHEKNESFVYL